MTKTNQSSKRGGKRLLRWLGGGTVVLLLIGALGYWKVFRGYAPREFMQDIKAGIAVREIRDPDERFVKYLEGRYGPMTDPANRQAAFLDFFNPEHIRALQFMVAHSPKAQRPENIAASARWVADYRRSLTPAERQALRARLGSDAGRSLLKRATAQYNAQDIYYRGQTAPVISQLLTTLHDVQSSPP
jgi:hypothetical protein